jgi:hypothetical protein
MGKTILPRKARRKKASEKSLTAPTLADLVIRWTEGGPPSSPRLRGGKPGPGNLFRVETGFPRGQARREIRSLPFQSDKRHLTGYTCR